MRSRWISPVLGLVSLVGLFVSSALMIDEGTYYEMSKQAQAHYHRVDVGIGFVGIAVSLAAFLFGMWAVGEPNDGTRRGKRQGCVGMVLGLVSGFLWLVGTAFPPYEF